MKPHKILIAAIVAVAASMLSCPEAHSQKYIADTAISDHITATDNETFAYDSKTIKGSFAAMREKGHKIVEIPNGEEVKFVKLNREPSPSGNDNLIATIVYNGETLYCYARDLKFSENNPKGVKDALKDIDFSPFSFEAKYKDADGNDAKTVVNTLDRHGDEARELYSYKYPVLAAILLLIGCLFIVISLEVQKKNGSKLVSSFCFVAASAFLLAMVVVEVKLFYRLGGDVTWWFDTDYFPRKTCAWRCIPFVVFVVIQALAGVGYALMLPPNKKGERVTGLGALLSVVLSFIPAILGGYFLALKKMGADPDALTLEQASQGTVMMLWIAAALMCIIPVIVYTIKCGPVGIVGGIALTAYWIGTVIIGFIVIKSILHLLFVILAPLLIGIATVVGVVLLAPTFLGGSGSKSGGGSSYTAPSTPKYQWKDMNGGIHNNEIDARAANERIIERRNSE